MTNAINLQALRGRIAEAKIKRQHLAALLGYSETAFSLYLNDRRDPPPSFITGVYNAIARLKKAEQAAQEAKQRVLAEEPKEPVLAQTQEAADIPYDRSLA